MLSKKEENEINLLRILSSSPDPMGSISLSLILEEQNAGISSATVGRLLTEMDRKGYTSKHGYKGRLLTDKGEARLTELVSKRASEEYSNRFIETLDVESKDNLIDILVARRGIEREIVRLAALNATEEDINAIRSAFANRLDNSGALLPEYDINFHRAIARASKNKVLMAAYDFIWQNGTLSPVVEFIRLSVHGVIARDHGRILDAIAARDTEKAERCMVEHIESLISDVHTYWNLAIDGAENEVKE